MHINHAAPILEDKVFRRCRLRGEAAWEAIEVDTTAANSATAMHLNASEIKERA